MSSIPPSARRSGLIITAMPQGHIALMVIDEAEQKVLVAQNFDPETARSLADQLLRCADMVEAGRPPVKK